MISVRIVCTAKRIIVADSDYMSRNETVGLIAIW